MNKPAEKLINKYLEGKCTPQEKRLVEQWYNQISGQQEPLAGLPDMEALGEHIYHKLRRSPGSVYRTWPFRLAAAASVLLIISAGVYLFTHKQTIKPTGQYAKNDIAPGGNKAMLTLANGRQIILTGAHNGKLAEQGNTAVNKTADGQLVYEASKITGNPISAVSYNTVKTPKTGKFDVILPDGTKVSLDAQSSIRFPTAFTGKERNVEITGQAYFEVEHDKAKPFRVRSKGQTVEVLGTHFNINAYDDEPSMKTTLLEGRIRISKNGQIVLLKPGQQARITYDPTNKNIKVTSDIDLNEIIAWKNGDFIFNDEDLQTTMRKVARWYDVEISYQDIPKNLILGGQVSRSKNMSSVLAAMELTGKVHFKVDGRRVTVMK